MPYESYLGSLSQPRSGVYKRVFRTQSPEETSGAILWCQAMATSLLALTSTFEVALRNKLHVSLSRQASSAVIGAAQDSYPWYDRQLGWKTLSGETLSKVEDLLCANGMRLATQPSPDRVISRLSFGVWPNILDSQLTQRQEQVTFNDVFAYHPNRLKKHWNYENARKNCVAVCKDVQNMRNRLSHCRPVWPEGWFRNGGTQHWTDMLNRLIPRRTSYVTVLSWICPGTAQLHTTSFAGRWFDQLATPDAVLAYVQQPLAAAGHLGVPPADPQLMKAYLART